jgi:hypothetical protein
MIMKKQNLFSSAILLAGLLSTGVANAAAYDAIINFDNNQVPADWTLSKLSLQNSYGIAQGQMFASATDSGGMLWKAYSPTSDVQSLRFEWDGAVVDSYWGAYTGIRIETADAKLHDALFLKSTYSFGSQSVFRLDEIPGTPQILHSRFGQLPNGTYRDTLTITDQTISFTVSNGGTIVFQDQVFGTPYHLSDIRKIGFVIDETVGSTITMDNLRFTASVPEPTIASFSCAGLAALLMMARRRSNRS